MNFTVTAAELVDLQWLSARTGWKFTENARGIVARNSKGEPRGVIAYDEWTPNSVRAHVACDTPAAWRALIPACFTYPFVECDKGLLLVGITGDNLRSLNTVRALGFQEVHRARDGWAVGVDLHFLEMRRESCRYLDAGRRSAAVAGHVTALWTRCARGMSGSEVAAATRRAQSPGPLSAPSNRGA